MQVTIEGMKPTTLRAPAAKGDQRPGVAGREAGTERREDLLGETDDEVVLVILLGAPPRDATRANTDYCAKRGALDPRVSHNMTPANTGIAKTVTA
jgi:hypothetical protein